MANRNTQGARTVPLLAGVTANNTVGEVFFVPSGHASRVFQATVKATDAGAVAATVQIEVSANDVNFMPLGTITLTGNGTATDGLPSNADWPFVRASVSGISGTGATVDVTMGS